MENELPMSVRSELAEARATADRCRRLEAELRDRERDLDECRGEVIAALELALTREADLARLHRALDEVVADRDDLQEEVTQLRNWRATLRIPQRIMLRVLRVLREKLR